ncbi:MAG: class F sortase [Acidimicrobiales bacterium]
MVVLIVTALLGAAVVTYGRPAASPPSPETARVASAAPSESRPEPGVALAIPDALVGDDVGLRDGPVAVPLELQLPTLGVRAPVAGVGITPGNVMDAPMGPQGDPVWQQAFWYRGSAVPGEASTALLAGHVNGPKGAPAVFADIDDLRPGDPIVVRDLRTGLDVRFTVTAAETYSLAEAADPAVLARMYGAGPVAGAPPEPSADGLAHLSLVTCAGVFRNGTHDRRLVVYATRDA